LTEREGSCLERSKGESLREFDSPTHCQIMSEETQTKLCNGCNNPPRVSHMLNGFRVACKTKECKFFALPTTIDSEYDHAIQQWNELVSMRVKDLD
jgi:hypothetical protein